MSEEALLRVSEQAGAAIVRPPASLSRPRAGGRLAYAALACAGTTWGTSFVFAKWALTELTVGHMLLYRFVFASIGFIPVIWNELRRSRGRVAASDVPLFATAAFFGVPVQFLVQYNGLARTTVAHAALMIALMPALLAAAAVCFAHERLRRSGWLALLASSAGAALIALGTHSRGRDGAATLAGDALVALSLLAGVVWVLVSQRLMRRGRGYSPTVTSAYVVTGGALVLIAWVCALDGPPPTALSIRTWIALAAQGFAATTAASMLWNWGLARVPASRAGVFVNLEPLVGTILGIALFGDRLGPLGALGGVLVLGAAFVVTRR